MDRKDWYWKGLEGLITRVIVKKDEAFFFAHAMQTKIDIGTAWKLDDWKFMDSVGDIADQDSARYDGEL